MTHKDRDRIEDMDRQWDRFTDGVHSGTGEPDEDLKRIGRLHQLDDTPAPPDELRNRLDADLRQMHPGRPSGYSVAGMDDVGDMDDDQRAHQPGRRVVSISRPRRLSEWGELAAMLLILGLVLVGATAYGDDTYDFAQRQLASQDQDNDPEHGMTFEDALDSAPFEMAMPSYVPKGLSFAWADTSSPTQYAADIGSWETARAELVFETGDADLPEVNIQFTPSSFHSAAPVWLAEEAHDIGGRGVVRTTPSNGAYTQYVWRQGDLYVSLSALIDPDAVGRDGRTEELPYSVAEIERMVESLIDQGPLESNNDEIQDQDVDLGEIAQRMSAEPWLPDPIPENLKLGQSNAWMDAVEMFFSHESDQRVGEITLMQSWRPGGHSDQGLEKLRDAGGETIEFGETTVVRHVLADWTGPEAVDYLRAVGETRPRVLRSWLPRNVDTGLVTYIWEIGDWRVMLGVEVAPQTIETDDEGEASLAEDAPEEDWLALVTASQAAEGADPGPAAHYSVLTREATDEDSSSGLGTDERRDSDEITESRLVHDASDYRIYLVIRSGSKVCHLIEHGGNRRGEGCSPLESAVERPPGLSTTRRNGARVYANLVPDGFEEVVDEDGEVFAEVENNVSVIEIEDGESRPSGLTARGPAGELSLDMP